MFWNMLHPVSPITGKTQREPNASEDFPSVTSQTCMLRRGHYRQLKGYLPNSFCSRSSQPLNRCIVDHQAVLLSTTSHLWPYFIFFSQNVTSRQNFDKLLSKWLKWISDLFHDAISFFSPPRCYLLVLFLFHYGERHSLCKRNVHVCRKTWFKIALKHWFVSGIIKHFFSGTYFLLPLRLKVFNLQMDKKLPFKWKNWLLLPIKICARILLASLVKDLQMFLSLSWQRSISLKPEKLQITPCIYLSWICLLANFLV